MPGKTGSARFSVVLRVPGAKRPQSDPARSLSLIGVMNRGY
jgi:hypothetical protein